MTRIFRENGDAVPVTVIEALPNRVTTVKTVERDGYSAVQVTVGPAPMAHRTTKAEAGHFAQAKVEPGKAAAPKTAPKAHAGMQVSTCNNRCETIIIT